MPRCLRSRAIRFSVPMKCAANATVSMASAHGIPNLSAKYRRLDSNQHWGSRLGRASTIERLVLFPRMCSTRALGTYQVVNPACMAR